MKMFSASTAGYAVNTGYAVLDLPQRLQGLDQEVQLLGLDREVQLQGRHHEREGDP